MKACACQTVKLLEGGSNDARGSGVSSCWDDPILGTVSSIQLGCLCKTACERVTAGSLLRRDGSGEIVMVQNSQDWRSNGISHPAEKYDTAVV